MGDRPVIFSAPMVRALLAGTKTQTRRKLRLQPIPFAIDDRGTLCDVGCLHVQGNRLPRVTLGRVVTLQEVPYAVGDRLWVREAWRATSDWDDHPPSKIQPGYTRYEADPCVAHSYGKLRLSIFMPRWASRLTLTVTEIRVERLQDISEEDAEAEGCQFEIWDQALAARDYSRPDAWFCMWGTLDGKPGYVPADQIWRESYRTLWNSLHGPDAWAANPWVAALTFTVTPANIDSLPEQP